MADIGLETTQASFPTYAELTQTRAWGGAPSIVSAAAPSASTSAPGDRYRESALLGVGGMGKVVLARDARIGRDVALKQLRPDREVDAEDRARFLREARVQGQLEHPSIVPVYDLEQRDDGTFFTMRRVLGRTLYAILDDLRAGGTAHSQRELLTAFGTVCLAVDYAHSRGVIHRDLKPANLMLGDFGEVYVLDWGLARVLDESAPEIRAPDDPPQRLSTPGTMMGTPLYMAPEQMHDPAVGPAADVFSLGLILFELLTLVHGRDPRALYAPIDARCSVRAPDRVIAPELEAICIRATDGDPAARYPSARALHAAVTRYLDGDRELEQRRTLAAQHAQAALAKLELSLDASADPIAYENARGDAMRELVRAMSLDPANPEHVSTLATLLQTPPRVVPAEVKRELHAAEQVAMRQGAQFSVMGMLTWFLFIPIVYAVGVVHAWMIWFILVPVGVAAALSSISLLRRDVPELLQLAVFVSSLLGMVAISRLYGPLVLGPTLIATYVITLQIHPHARMRLIAFVLGAAAMIAPVVLEAVGVLPASYLYADGRMTIVPQLLVLTPHATNTLLLIATLLTLIAPAFFVNRIRAELSAAERRQVMQAWHFRRLADYGAAHAGHGAGPGAGQGAAMNSTSERAAIP